MQFPSSGNLLVLTYNDSDWHITGVTDNLSNTWSVLPNPANFNNGVLACIAYAANANTSPNLGGITVTLNGTPNRGDAMTLIYDIVGASTNPFDVRSTATGTNNSSSSTAMESITPTTSNGIVIHVDGVFTHTLNSMSSPTGGFCDIVVNDLQDDVSQNLSTLDMDNGYGHYFNPNTNAITFTFGSTGPPGLWASYAAAFRAGPVTPGPGHRKMVRRRY
jgi:hypothetical protein